MKEIVIGESDFKGVLVRDNYYIDKTILILKSPIGDVSVLDKIFKEVRYDKFRKRCKIYKRSWT